MSDIYEILNKTHERSDLIEIIHNMREHGIDYNNLNTLKIIANHLKTTVADIYGTLTFYGMFSSKEYVRYTIKMCASTVCHLKEASKIRSFACTFLDCNEDGISKDGLFRIERVECLGLCNIAPAAIINDKVYGNLNVEKFKRIIEEIKDENGS